MKNIFSKNDVDEFIERINKLTSSSQPQWGKMNVAQMLAHCNVAYEMFYTDKHSKPTGIKAFFLKKLVKNFVVSDKPYKKSSQTAPAFLMTSDKNFEEEKERLIGYIKKTLELGADHFDGKESNSFGVLNKDEWNNLFSKHLNHHLTQFGV